MTSRRSMEPPLSFNGLASTLPALLTVKYPSPHPSTLYVVMADSRSHSVFISIHHPTAKVRKRIFNQRVEHSSPTAQKFHVTHMCHVTDETDVACAVRRLFFIFAQVPLRR